MSPRLPTVTASGAIRVFKKSGFDVIGQKGSHVLLKNDKGIHLIIPNHAGDLKRPLLKALIKHAGLTEDSFRELL